MAGRRQYTDGQTVAILKEAAAGAKASELCRQDGVSEKTLDRWRNKFAGMTMSGIKKMRALEEENAKLKRKVAELVRNIDTVKEPLLKYF